MPNVSYDTLSIKIEADSKQANASVKSLSANLQKLDETTKALDTKRIQEVKGLLQGIAKIDFSNVTKGLESVVNAFKAMSKGASSTKAQSNKSLGLQVPQKGTEAISTEPTVFEKVNAISDLSLDTTSLKDYNQLVAEISSRYQQVILSVEELQKATENVLTPTELLGQKLNDLGLNGTQIKQVFASINYETDKFNGEQIEGVAQALRDMGFSGEKVDDIISRLKKDVEELGKKAGKSASGFTKLTNQFIKIMKYRIIRKIIQEIYKAIKEGVTNIASFDSGVQDSLSRLTSAFSYLKNSIGAMFAPLIQIVTPILETLMMIVGELANTFAEFFSAMNGASTFSKATYELKEYNKEAQKTQSIGIDELNVLQPQDNGGGFTTEAVTMGKETEGLASALKDVVATLKDLFDDILGTLKDVLKNVLPQLSKLLEPILKIVKFIIDIVGKFIGETNDGASNLLGNVLGALGSIVDIIASIIETLMPAIQMIVTIIAEVINLINDILGAIFECVGEIFKALKPIFQFIATVILPVLTTVLAIVTTILEVLKAIIETLVYLVTFQWGKIGSAWGNAGKKIEEAWKRVGDSWNGKTYATGGFPEDGLFYANHNELVGQFSNGKTAVANNEQITQGIYLAVLQAMRDSEGGNKTISIQIDGKEIAKAVNKQNANAGYEGINGGYKYGY